MSDEAFFSIFENNSLLCHRRAWI